MNNVLTCINCPVGCRMTVSVTDQGKFLSVSGNTCPRGAAYAKQEFTRPMRMITAVIPAQGSDVPLSVKTSAPVPKEYIREIMRELGRVTVTSPVPAGTVIIHDVLNTGTDIVATRSV